MHLKNFILTRTFFLIASYQILENDVILINHGSFFQGKDFLKLNRFQFFDLLESNNFVKFVMKRQGKKFGKNKNLLNALFFCISDFFHGK